nr:hypothetical protein [Pseudaminobacter arsenicus]
MRFGVTGTGQHQRLDARASSTVQKVGGDVAIAGAINLEPAIAGRNLRDKLDWAVARPRKHKRIPALAAARANIKSAPGRKSEAKPVGEMQS